MPEPTHEELVSAMKEAAGVLQEVAAWRAEQRERAS